MEQLLAIFQSFGGPSKHKVLNCFHKKYLQRGDFLVHHGKVCSHIAFVEAGCFQFFFYKEEIEITFLLTTGNYFITSMDSFLHQIPARENIRALTSATVWLLSKCDFDTLLKDDEEFRAFYIRLLEHRAVCANSYLRDLLSLNAEERYEKLLTEEPALLQQIPLQYVASILGITPRHLSRIRKKIQYK